MGHLDFVRRKRKPMITLDSIVKQYNKKVILNDISLVIKLGDSVAFTGHNGCGKSTLLKVVAGLVAPTSGKVKYQQPFLFHYVPEHFPKMNFSSEEYLMFQGRLSGMKEGALRERIQELSEDFFFESMLYTKMKDLSKGSLQKVGVIQALLKQPEVLLLDEPLSGQDVASQQVFIDKINDMRRKGVTILMSCHEPYLIDAITEQTYHFEQGKLAALYKERQQSEKWFVLFFDQGSNSCVPEKWKGHLQFVEGGCKIRCSQQYSNEIILDMLQEGWNLRGMWDEDSK